MLFLQTRVAPRNCKTLYVQQTFGFLKPSIRWWIECHADGKCSAFATHATDWDEMLSH